jgi:hypothetical protein
LVFGGMRERAAVVLVDWDALELVDDLSATVWRFVLSLSDFPVVMVNSIFVLLVKLFK